MQDLSYGLLQEVTSEISRIVDAACQLCKKTGKKGGYLCITDHAGELKLLLLVGTITNKKKARKYRRLVQEKARRLAQYPGHVSSWQSRDEKNGKWGGAIRIFLNPALSYFELIFSFSGLTEALDEACMLALAQSMRTGGTPERPDPLTKLVRMITRISGTGKAMERILKETGESPGD